MRIIKSHDKVKRSAICNAINIESVIGTVSYRGNRPILRLDRDDLSVLGVCNVIYYKGNIVSFQWDHVTYPTRDAVDFGDIFYVDLKSRRVCTTYGQITGAADDIVKKMNKELTK